MVWPGAQSPAVLAPDTAIGTGVPMLGSSVPKLRLRPLDRNRQLLPLAYTGTAAPSKATANNVKNNRSFIFSLPSLMRSKRDHPIRLARRRGSWQHSGNTLRVDGKSHSFGVAVSGHCSLRISQRDGTVDSKCRLRGTAESSTHQSVGGRKRKSERQA